MFQVSRCGDGDHVRVSRLVGATSGIWSLSLALILVAASFFSPASAQTNTAAPTAEVVHPESIVDETEVQNAQFQPVILPTPLVAPPQLNAATSSPASPTSGIALTSFGRLGTKPATAAAPASAVAGATEARTRVSTDVSRLLGDSPGLPAVDAQRRTPVVTANRVRGSRVGALLASGSHWVPARMDLDSMLSKIDSRLIEEVLVIPGPYSARYGPGFDFIDARLLPSPRFEQGPQKGGSTSFDYKANGEQWYGRQSIWGGDEKSGYRVGYGHRTGNDYESGDGENVPSSYNSREFDVAIGRHLSDDHLLEFNYLRLDQTGIEFPGQAFDIDWLVTDGFELLFEDTSFDAFDRLTVEGWYNRTRFEGDNLQDGKRRQFPFYESEDILGETDVDSMSTGYFAAIDWEGDSWKLTVGSDLRFIRQELNENIDQGGGTATGNSPVPRSHQSNPGLFTEFEKHVGLTRLRAGARLDWISSNVDDDPEKLMDIGIRDPDLPFRSSLADILGTNDFDRDEQLIAAHLTAERQLDVSTFFSVGVGYAERPPTLTELYAAQPFMFLLQSGLNTVTGDPTLESEKRWQFDVGLRHETEYVRSGINGFHAWVQDYITFENLGTFPSNRQPEQVRLRFTNTDLATLAGGEFYTEAEMTSNVTVFATMSYLEGRDQDRNGDDATQRATTTQPLMTVPGESRGAFSGITGGEREALPGIHPVQSHVGIRLHDSAIQRDWSVELSARIVSGQDRVAESLLETVTPGFTVWDLRSYLRMTDAWTITLGVENLADRQYREYLDFRPLSGGGLAMSQPGINFYVGSELTY